MVRNPFKYAEGQKIQIMAEQRGQIKSLYLDLYNHVKGELKYLSRSTSQYAIDRKAYLNGLKKDLAQSMRNVDAQTETIINGNMDKAVQAVLENNQIYLSGLGYSSYIDNGKMKNDVLKRIATGQIYGGKWNLSKAIWGDDKAKINEINKIIAQGVAQNKTAEEIARMIQKYVNPSVKIPLNIPGVRGTIDYNALRLAKTAVQHAYQQAFVSATRLNPFIDAYRWVTSGNGNVCPLCIERAETDQYGLGEGIFPKDALPLDHPNGQCTFEVVTSMSDAEIADAIADWYLGEGDDGLNKELDMFAKYLM